MSKHIEIKVRDSSEKVTIITRERDVYGRLMRSRERQVTVSRREFERALNAASIEVPWKGLL